MRAVRLPFAREFLVAVLGLVVASSFPGTAGAAWVNSGPNGMAIYDIAVDPSTTSTVYLANAIKGVYKSVNGGASFVVSADGFTPEDAGMVELSVNPIQPQIIFAGGKNLWRSQDGGIRWNRVGAGLPPAGNEPKITDILIDRNNTNIIYVSSDAVYNGHFGGVYKSIDGGNTFTDFGPPITIFRVRSLAMDCVDSNILYASLWGSGLGGGVWRSANGGLTWGQTSPNTPEGVTWSVAADPSIPGRVLAGGANFGLYESRDSGFHWVQIFSSIPFGFSPGDSEIGILGGTIFFASEGGGVYRTLDGVNWTHLTNGVPTAGLQELALNGVQVYSAGKVWFNLYKSVDSGGTWARYSKGFLPVDVATITASTTQSPIAYAGATSYMGLYKTADHGRGWSATMLPTLPSIDVAADLYNPSVVLASAIDVFSGGPNDCRFMFRSNDGGEHFAMVLGNVYSLGEIAFDPRNTQTVYSIGRLSPFTTRHMLRSDNNGVTWSQVQDDGLNGLSLLSLAIDGDGYLYAGTSGSGVYRSVDGGLTWVPRNHGIETLQIRSLSKYTLAQNGIIAGTNGGVYRSIDGGANWALLAGMASPITDVLSEKVLTYVGGIAETRPGLWASLDTGGVQDYDEDTGQWTPLDPQFHAHVRELALTKPTAFGATMYSTLHGAAQNGVYEWTFVNGMAGPHPVIHEATGSVAPASMQLRVFPNPAGVSNASAGGVTIEFALPVAADASLSVFDASGRRVASLLDCPIAAGPHSAAWSARDAEGAGVPAGVYFVRLRVGETTTTRQLVLTD